MNLQQLSPIVMNQNEVTIKLLKQHREMTVPLLQRLTGFGESTCRRTFERLALMGICHEVKVKGKNYYRIGRAPRKELKSREYKPFSGVVWKPEVNRPGCQDFLQYPSRMGDQLVPHKPMIHGCVPSTGVSE